MSLFCVNLLPVVDGKKIETGTKVCQKMCASERFLVNIFLTNTNIAETKVSLESL